MAWRRSVAIVGFLAFTGLPAVGAVCAMACESASAQGMAHHGAGHECEQTAQPAAGPLARGVDGHDCSTHDASMRLLAATKTERAHLGVKFSTLLALTAAPGALEIVNEPLHSFDDTYTTPPGTAPPTVRPVVLRV